MTMRAFLPVDRTMLKSMRMTDNPVNLVCQASLFNLSPLKIILLTPPQPSPPATTQVTRQNPVSELNLLWIKYVYLQNNPFAIHS